MSVSVFSPRLVTIWILAIASAFLVSIAVMTFGGGDRTNTVQADGANSFSRSAVGQAGFAELLRGLGISVVQSEYASRSKLGAGGLLVIAEPRLMGQSLKPLSDLLDAPNILLVLPKRFGLPDEDHPEWIGQSGLLPVEEATAALTAAVPGAEVERQDDAASWNIDRLGITPDTVGPVQLMHSSRLTPIVANDAGMLVGALDKNGHRLWVLSDPDLIANHGILRGDNAGFAVALIDVLRRGDGKVVFDETIHGFDATPPSPLKLLFAFPYVLATVQGVVAIAILLWATLARFGAPERLAPILQAGKYGLIGQAAQLLERGGHQRAIVRRYVEAMIREMADRLHAPRGLSEAALMEWFRRLEQARGVALDCGAIRQRAVAAATLRRDDPAVLLPIARDIHRWKGAMLDGSE